ncbi:hypothetical protein A6R68_05070, partial [Neotoma lepida]
MFVINSQTAKFKTFPSVNSDMDRHSHVTSDDTGMCEMVLIDHDVDLEKTHPPSVPGDAQELKSLFEKKSLKEKPPSSGKQSILSVRLEQCPLQLNNPFNEYSKFDGKPLSVVIPSFEVVAAAFVPFARYSGLQGHVGTTATKKIDVYLPLHSSQDRLLPMTVVTMASARVQDLIGLICWQYTSEGREPKLNDNVSAYCLHIAEDDGEVDTDFPPLDSNEPIHKFGFSTLALVEKYSSPGLTSKESLFVR